ncbi:MAG TPA: hypothetical protein DCP68_08075 [Ruminococcus sp.]|nr:hypothetical protein [Ruminococcus sp.]
MSEPAVRERRNLLPVLTVYSVIFYGIWAVWALLIRPAYRNAFGETLLPELCSSAVKVLIWAVPALLLVKRFEPEMTVGLRQMFTQKVPLKWILFWTLLFAAISGGERLIALLRGTLHINPAFSIASHQWLLIVGITEEAVFRGWLLNATAKNEKDWKPIAVNAVMFLCIHFPGWIKKGMFVSAFTGFGFVSIMLFSVLASVCFLKHKNLLLPVFLHMLYDFILEFWLV